MTVPELPAAVVTCPSCGACGKETTGEDDYFVCYECQLMFSGPDLAASYLDPDAEPCGKPCDNTWHGPGRIRDGMTFVCHPCRLPKGHESGGSDWFHWTGCEQQTIQEGAR